MTTAEQIDAAVAAAQFGEPTARKTGRDARWPYVPVIHHPATDQTPREWAEQIKGLAYETRDEAIESATYHIEQQRKSLARRLLDPRMRALRESHGLPREI